MIHSGVTGDRPAGTDQAQVMITHKDDLCLLKRLRIALIFLQKMAINHVGNWEVLLQTIAGMDGTSCGREGLAAAAKQQQQHCHAVYRLTEEFKKAKTLDKSVWEKLVNEIKVRVEPRSLAQSTMQHAAGNVTLH